VAARQRERWYEAMCTQREWTVGEWRDLLAAHPVLRHLVGRVVWQLVRLDTRDTRDDGGEVAPPATFRPLEDGTLTDAHDDDVDLDLDADLELGAGGDGDLRIRIAHAALLPGEEVAAWHTHLADYEVVPWLAQFDRGEHELTDAMRRATAITDREGHLLSSFQLRGRAGKLGWTRGRVEAGAWFYDYHRDFPGVGIRAVLTFTGTWVPEEERTVALESLSFHRLDEPTRAHPLRLGQVPPVLLAEAWSDLHELADLGSGYDPDWRSKADG